MSSSKKEVLKIHDLRMSYPDSKAWIIDGFNLQVNEGERLALIGSSGCGKSTVAKSVIKLLPQGTVIEGKIYISGQEVLTADELTLQRIRGEEVGLVFQDPMTRLNPLMQIGDHLVDTLMAHRPTENLIWCKKRAAQLLDTVGISLVHFESYPYELSGGMRQRLGIALAIALNPSLVIADEPTTSLDTAIASQVMGELISLCNQLGTALLLITHDLALASTWCERIAILEKGKIIETGFSSNILQKPQSIIGRRLVRAARSLQKCRKENLCCEKILLDIRSLRCWHRTGSWPWTSGWIKAINEVTFSLYQGETLGVVGVSGCGKSTLCRALMGLVPIRGGEVKFNGQNLYSLDHGSRKKLTKNVQMVFQDPFASLNPKMEVWEAIVDPLLVHNVCSRSKAKEKARELLSLVGLIPVEKFERKLPHELSGGQQQRVAIARSLTLNPKILICDESVSMLDSEIQSEILELLNNLQRKFGLSMLFITHDLSVACSFCDRLIVLDQGNIVEEGSGDDLLNSPKSKLTQKLVSAIPQIA